MQDDEDGEPMLQELKEAFRLYDSEGDHSYYYFIVETLYFLF